MSNRDEIVETALAAIAEGTPIDWEALGSSSASDSVRTLLADLRIVAGVAASGQPVGHAPPVHTDAGLQPTMWGDLEVLERIGSGAYGDVYRAWDPRLQRHVALKVLKPGPAGAHAATGLRESRLLARVHHPHVVTVHSVEQVGDSVGIVMELVRGQSLDALLASTGRLPPDRVARIGVELCQALAAVHQAGLVHRDVTARNVMIDDAGRVVLMDLGSGMDPRLDVVGAAGTPLYLAPEIFEGASPSPTSDLYSVGVVLFHLLTGRYPIAGRTLAELTEAHRRGARTPLRHQFPDAPGGLAQIIEKALSPDVSRRHAHATSMAAALRQWLDEPSATQAATATRQPTAWMAGLAVLVGAAVWSVGAARPPLPDQRAVVLVVPIQNQTGDPALDGAVDALLDRAISDSRHVSIASASRIDDALTLMGNAANSPLTLPLALDVSARDGGIHLVITGALRRQPTGLSVEISGIVPESGVTLMRAGRVAGGTATLARAVGELASQVLTVLGDVPPQANRTSPEPVTTASLRALTLYTQSYRLATRSVDRTWPAALSLVREAVALDPEFPAAWTWLAWSLYRTGASPLEYMDAAAQAVTLAPRATLWEQHWIRGSHALLAGDVTAAAREYEALRTYVKDHYWGVWNLYTCYLRLGRGGDAARLAQEWAALRPLDHLAQYRAVDALAKNGEYAATIPYAQQALSIWSGPIEARAQLESWLVLLPAFEAFRGRDARTTTGLLDAVAASLSERLPQPRDELARQVAWFQLALGRTTSARDAATHMSTEAERQLALAEIAYFSGEQADARRLLEPLRPRDRLTADTLRGPFLVWLHIRTRSPAAASVLAEFRGLTDARHLHQWLTGELALQEGRPDAAIEPLLEARSSFVVGTTNWYLFSTALARAQARLGRTEDAAAILEDVVRAGRGETLGQAVGRLWMPAALDLARLRELHGDSDGARELRDAVDRLLALADPDFVLRQELDAAQRQ